MSGGSVSVYIDTSALHENFLSNDLKRSCFQTTFKAWNDCEKVYVNQDGSGSVYTNTD